MMARKKKLYRVGFGGSHRNVMACSVTEAEKQARAALLAAGYTKNEVAGGANLVEVIADA